MIPALKNKSCRALPNGRTLAGNSATGQENSLSPELCGLSNEKSDQNRLSFKQDAKRLCGATFDVQPIPA